ncbi:MAG: hypothetical protein AB8H79_04600 [Myxococcota bacterium]
MDDRTTQSLTNGFVALTLAELVLQVGALALILGQIISVGWLMEAYGTWVLIVLGLSGLITLSARVVGSLVLARHGRHLRDMGVPKMRLTPWAWIVFWLPLPIGGLWAAGLLQLEASLMLGGTLGLLVLIVVTLGVVVLHEIMRASAPDQMTHWRFVPLSGVVVGWGVATAIDAVIPIISPLGLIASIVLVRRVGSRMRDKAIVVRELGLLAAKASARATAPEASEATS